MAVLARDSPLKGPLQLGPWLQHLLYFAADAAAAQDWMLASRALDGFAAAAMVRFDYATWRINLYAFQIALQICCIDFSHSHDG